MISSGDDGQAADLEGKGKVVFGHCPFSYLLPFFCIYWCDQYVLAKV